MNVAKCFNFFYKLSNIFKLEVLKFVYNFKKNALPKCFSNYYQSDTQTQNYSRRFASENNLFSCCVIKCSKSSTNDRFDTHVGYMVFSLPLSVKQLKFFFLLKYDARIFFIFTFPLFCFSQTKIFSFLAK